MGNTDHGSSVERHRNKSDESNNAGHEPGGADVISSSSFFSVGERREASSSGRVRKRGLMRGFAHPYFLALLVGAFGIACGSVDHPDMELEITFDGLGCFDARVDEVTIDFETGNVGFFSVDCDTRGPLRVLIDDVPPRVQRVLVLGYDGGFPVYSLRVEIDHRGTSGSRLYRLDLREASEVITRFTFAGVGNQDGMTCEEAGIDVLDIEFGDLSFVSVPCESDGVDGAILQGIAAGVYDVSLVAFDGRGRALYESSFPRVQIFDGSNDLIFNLLPLEPAELEFRWVFDNTADCRQAGVITVEYVLLGPEGQVVSYDPEVAACDVEGHVWTDLRAGLYTLEYIEGIGTAGYIRYRRTSVPLFAPAGDRAVFDVNLRRF